MPSSQGLSAHDVSASGPRSWLAPLGATFTLQTVNAYLYSVIPTLAPVLSASAGVSRSFVGWLAAISTLGSIAFMLLGTPLIRRYGAIRVLQAGTVLGGAGVLLFYAPGMLPILIGTVLMGLGYGPSTPAGSDVLQRFAPARHRGLVFSMRQAGVPLSGLAAGLVLPSLYTAGGWDAVVLSSIGIVAFSVMLVQPVRSRVDANRDAQEHVTLRRLLSPANLAVPLRAVRAVPGMPRIAFAGSCLAVGHGCWAAYLVTYLTDALGESLVDAGVVFAVMQGAGVGGRLLLGWISDRVGSGAAVMRGVALASAATSLVLVLAAPMLSPMQLWAFAALAGITVMSWNGVQVALVAARAPRDGIAACSSGATTLLFLGFVAGPAAFALLLDATHSYLVCFGATAAVTLLGGLLLLGVGADPVAGDDHAGLRRR